MSLITGVAVAFYFGWNMAPIGVATAVILVVLQTSVSQYLKRRGMKDVEIAEEASRVSVSEEKHDRLCTGFMPKWAISWSATTQSSQYAWEADHLS